MAARYAGYRANWAIQRPLLKPGEYVQSLVPPRALPATTPHADRGTVTDRDAETTGRSMAPRALPGLTIRYRIELADSTR
jgi:hypothetical protein